MEFIAVTDSRMSNEQLKDIILRIEPQIDAVILREKTKTDVEVFDLVKQLMEAGFNPKKIIVHGRPDIAMLAGIHKIQLPGHGLPLHHLKRYFPSLSIGRSIHSFREAQIAYRNGADWLLYGHLYSTSSKPDVPPRGTDEICQIATAFPIPVYAIGGIHPFHLAELQSTQIKGVALMSAIFSSNTPEESLAMYKEQAKTS